MVKVST